MFALDETARVLIPCRRGRVREARGALADADGDSLCPGCLQKKAERRFSWRKVCRRR